ncbi:MAG: protein kinase [Desulfobacterales bacterium]|nr:protein kinase [Desulfobacterales bacterium]
MKRIGRYRVRGLLGRGGMSRVYKVAHPVIGRTFALKRLEPTEPLERILGRARLRTIFVEEIRCMVGIDHPNVVAILDADEDREQPFYVMDYHCNNLGQAIGESYRTERPSRRLPVERAAAYGLQILAGLARLHHAGIVHRDIKPFNILLTSEDQVKIGDFGLSRLRGETFDAPATLKVGSPFYAPPEQETNPDRVGFNADLFAFGVMLYRMLTGRLPEDPPHSASRWQPELDSAWDGFFHKALAADPAARYQQADAMGVELTALIERWRENLTATCRSLPAAPLRTAARPGEDDRQVRRTPVRTGPKIPAAQFGLDDLWRPRASRPPHLRPEKDRRLLTDLATNLTWQRGGAAFALDWHRAGDYIRGLNQSRLGARDNWRLPTIEELITLLQPQPGGLAQCLPSDFDRSPQRLWSCDRRAYTSAWYVSLDLGFVGWQDLSCRNGIKAVSSPVKR